MCCYPVRKHGYRRSSGLKKRGFITIIELPPSIASSSARGQFKARHAGSTVVIMVDRSAGRRSYGPRPCRSSPTLGWLSACALLLGLSCQADEVKVGFGDRMPPYCLPQTESGIEVDIFREALAFRGHILKPVFYPLKRVAVAFKAKQIDAAMIDSGMDLRAYGGIYAQSAVIYDNVFITLADRHLKIAAPGDLRNLHVLAFPGALERYPIWLTPVKDAGNYTELNDQGAAGADTAAGALRCGA